MNTVRVLKIATAVLSLSIISINADDNSTGCYYKGMFLAQAGIGLGFYGSVYGNESIPPLSASVEYGIHNLVSIGGGLGIEGSSYDYSFNGYGWK